MHSMHCKTLIQEKVNVQCTLYIVHDSFLKIVSNLTNKQGTRAVDCKSNLHSKFVKMLKNDFLEIVAVFTNLPIKLHSSTAFSLQFLNLLGKFFEQRKSLVLNIHCFFGSFAAIFCSS